MKRKVGKVKSFGAPWIGGLVDPRTGLDNMEKRKFFYPWQDLNPNHSVIEPIASGYPSMGKLFYMFCGPLHFSVS
jgi:hypothetical protein